ncbi:GNAT family N-acetyltransferase [Nocardia cyriacigeorgica]|jgi:GNAT superfamily N-acetyltransferase|uniref:GNAT family N-acetyltransferase n=1 Tax=Nocardia cyriacigeorgica TaxID=135487 RepID=UPI0018941250|nr:GNAT family N-acetyltransferase [Nocardia cyriacigeorgica]MBF6496497.1 GNAT family N-acetyltransferase [Nocardia cyriacigeorgica]
MGDTLTVRRASEADRDAVVDAFGKCSDEAVTAWVLEGHSIEPFIDQHVPMIIDRGLKEDEIWIAGAGDDIWAVSIWQYVTSPERFVADAEEARAMREQAPDLSVARRLEAVTSLLAAEHPREFPHQYLQVIVTVPEHRGKGAGAAILGDRLKVYTEQQVPAFLEASTERSSRLYARCGFEATGKTHPLPENGPTLIPMWFRP